jgi:hypothetical protein
MHGTSEARVNTPGLIAMPALKRKRHLTISFYANTRQRAGNFSLKCFYDISCPGMLSQAVNPTKPTAHAGLFFYIHSLHFRIPLYMAYGNRLPHTIITYYTPDVKTLQCSQLTEGSD